jgi:hypothetical protein
MACHVVCLCRAAPGAAQTCTPREAASALMSHVILCVNPSLVLIVSVVNPVGLRCWQAYQVMLFSVTRVSCSDIFTRQYAPLHLVSPVDLARLVHVACIQLLKQRILEYPSFPEP